MRLGTALLIAWLAIGAIAGAQRHDYTGQLKGCSQTATIALTIIAGPLNYFGVNPKASCTTPEPSK